MTEPTAAFWINHLGLTYHVEGGCFAETYRSSLTFNIDQLPAGFTGIRNACTHIYFLLESHQFSAFHRIRSDELWHFYSGDPLVIYEIDEAGGLTEHLLGNDPGKGQSLFQVIPAGSWFASRVAAGGVYGLVGCTVAPGFDFQDFELAVMEELVAAYPAYGELIRSLCRSSTIV